MDKSVKEQKGERKRRMWRGRAGERGQIRGKHERGREKFASGRIKNVSKKRMSQKAELRGGKEEA